MIYKFCSICGSRLKKVKNDNLACTQCNFMNYRNPRPTATAIVIYKNKILLTKRAKAPFKNYWDLPGGFIERGEYPQKAAIRELKEETGLNIKITGLLGIYPDYYTYHSDSFSTLCIVYTAKSTSAKLKAMDDVLESKWFSKQVLPTKISFKSNQLAIKDFLKIWK